MMSNTGENASKPYPYFAEHTITKKIRRCPRICLNHVTHAITGDVISPTLFEINGFLLCAVEKCDIPAPKEEIENRNRYIMERLREMAP